MRVLVVDDEIMIVEMLKRAFAVEGYIVDYAYDGTTALQKALENNYDAMVLDIIMPELNGLELCRKIREAGITSPILFLSSMQELKDKVAGLDSGADDYLIKPFTFTELAARIRALLRRPADVLPVEYTSGPYVIDSTKHSLTKFDVPIYLSRHEFALLEYLIIHKNRVVTKDELLQKVWGVASKNASNRVEACVKSIREKLDDPDPSSLIQTVRGLGYTIAVYV